MSLANRVRRALDRASAAFAVSQVYRPIPESVPDLPLWMQGNPFGLGDEELKHGDAFEQVPIVHAIVRLIQNDCAGLPRKFYSGKRELTRKFGNMVDVWEGGNDRDTGHEFRVNLFGDLELYGNAFIYLERGRGRRPPAPPYAVWTLHPPSVRVVPGPNRTIQEYVWYGAGEPESMPAWSIIHVKKYSAKDELVGTTWVEPARADWMAQWYALRIMQQFFARGGISPGTWSPDYQNNVGAKMKEHEIKAMQDKYAARFQSFDRLWRPVIMDGFKKVESGQTIGDLRLDENVTLINANLCRAAGVPPWMLGIREAGSLDQGKSSETSSENYWRSTIGNPCRLVDQVFTERFCPLFPGGDGVIMETDYDEVPALQQARLEMMTGAVTAVGGPVISVNEAREQWGDDPSPLPEHDIVGGSGALFDAQALEQAAQAQENPQQPQPGGQQPPQELPATRAVATARREALGEDGRPVQAASRRQHVDRLRKRQEKRLVREERKMATAWEVIRDEQERFALSVLARRKMATVDVDADSLYMAVTEDQKARLARLIQEAMESAAIAAADEVGIEVAIDLWLETVAAYINRRTDVMIQRVSATDREKLREVISKAVREGKDVTEIQGLVREFFSMRRSNSMTIARTEMAGPVNRAQFDTWKAAGVRRKWWMTMQDDAVRPAHVHAGDEYGHGSSIGMSEPFILKDSHGHLHGCMVPGETGVAELDINCRCQVMPDLEHFESGVRASRPEANGDAKPWVNRVFPRWSDRVFSENGSGS